MVVADHESRTLGRSLVPIFAFHIPAFIAGGPVEPRIVSRLASQTDLLPTVLSLMGLQLGDDVVILVPDQPPRHFAVNGHVLTPADRDADLERDALAYTQWPVVAYKERWYR